MSKKLVQSTDYDPIFNRMIELCESQHKTVSQLLDVFASSRSAINTWKKGNISANLVEAISNYLNVSTSYLLTGKENNSLSDEEEKLIMNYRSLSEQGQEYIQQQMFMAKEVYKKADIPDS